ncbi:MAG: hypothetical protein IPH03_00710 [Tetrasphaera sp.]|nr:hypothetical protein [Tetrasphaera sp.]
MSTAYDIRVPETAARAPGAGSVRLLTWFVVGLPLWWLLGLGSLGYFLVAALLGVDLVRRRPWQLPLGSAWWLLFLAWVVLSIVMLPLEAPGTVVEGIGARIIPTAFRLGEYAACTLTLIWACTTSAVELSARRLGGLLAVAFGWTVAGGLLGLVAPGFQVTSLVERVLPGSLAGNGYVHALVHPAAAQVQRLFAGEDGVGRPAAPYPYTNTWGNALGLLLPIGCALIVQSGVAGPLAIVAVLATPLGAGLADRNAQAPSNGVRAFSVARAIEITTASPVLGYGSTRSQLGSHETIAVGKSASCPKCGNMALGTNGQLWFAGVGQGFVGAGFFALFHVAVLWYYRRLRSPLGLAALTSCVGALVFMLVYDRTVATGCLEFLIIALLVKVAREEDAEAGAGDTALESAVRTG